MLIEDIFNHHPWIISPNKTIKEAVKILIKDKCNGLIVKEGDKVVGVLALQDIAGATVPKEFRENVNLASAMFKQGMFKEICMELSEKKVSDIMRTNYLSVGLNTNIMAVMADFLKNDLYIVPVLDNGKLLGVVTRGDVRRAIAIKMDI